MSNTLQVYTLWLIIIIPAIFLLMIILAVFYDAIVPPVVNTWFRILNWLSKLDLKNPFGSKRGAKNTIALGCFLTFLIKIVGLMWLSDLKSKGYIDVGRGDPVIAKGSDAAFTIYGVLFGALAVFIYTLYLTICYFAHYKAKKYFESRTHNANRSKKKK